MNNRNSWPGIQNENVAFLFQETQKVGVKWDACTVKPSFKSVFPNFNLNLLLFPGLTSTEIDKQIQNKAGGGTILNPLIKRMNAFL